MRLKLLLCCLLLTYSINLWSQSKPDRGQGGNNANPRTQAAPCSANETIIATHDVWPIGGQQFNIKSISLVHLTGQSGMVSIQVEAVLPGMSDVQEWAYLEGIKFAQYLVGADIYQQVLTKATEMNMLLVEEIGVTFINPATGQGFNTKIRKEDYLQ